MDAIFDLRFTDFYSNNLELLGVITGILNVVILTFARWPRLQWWNWPLGVVNALAYLILFWQWGLYGNFILQPYFLVICLVGCWLWRAALRGKAVEELPTRWASGHEFGLVTLLSLAAMFFVYPLLDYFDDPQPFWDGLILTLSLGASWLQLRKKVQSWWLWIAVDIIAVPFHWSQGYPATSTLYFVYGVVCVYGLYDWLRDANKTGDLETAEVVSEVPFRDVPITLNDA